MSPSDVRRRRQLDQLRALCTQGAVARAIDLAFEHIASFGPDDEIIGLLEAAAAQTELGDRVAELRAVRR